MNNSIEGKAMAAPSQWTGPGTAGIPEAYRDYLRASVDWLWSCDRDLILREISAPGVAYDRPLPHAPIHQSVEKLVDHSRDEDGLLLSRLRAGRPFRDLPARLDGQQVLLSGVPAYDTRDRFCGYRGSARKLEGNRSNIDAWKLLKEFERLLVRSNEIEWRLSETARRAQATRDHLASLLHELRTPLNAVNGYAELARGRLQTGNNIDDLRQDLERLAEAGSHIAQMLQSFQDNTLETTASEDGDSDGNDVPVVSTSLGQAMTEASAMVELSARQAGVHLHAPPREAAQVPQVRGDRSTVRQILVNLLSNAIKFTPSGGEVGMRVNEDRNGLVRVAVWDTGPGIAHHEQERIFERRYRVATSNSSTDSANVNVPDGQGLGLAIARDLARQAGGELSVESRLNDGATFFLDLPAAGSRATACA